MKYLMFILSFALLLGCVQDSGSMESSTEQSDDKEADAMMAEGIPYVPYTEAAYMDARSEGKVIFLEFYANWCPICASQEVEIKDALSSLDYSDVAAFRVNYKDSDTDNDEKDLAREFGIIIQHTHVLLGADGKLIKKSSEVWDKDTIVSEIESARGG